MRRIVPLTPILAVVLAVTPVAAQTNERPNVVLIITDDVGYGDFGSYGAPDVKTPNIDSLARDGVQLTDFYANGATCSPTRTGLISGRYQQRFAIEAPLSLSRPVDL
jgi:arylsulfatase A-like enzyme